MNDDTMHRGDLAISIKLNLCQILNKHDYYYFVHFMQYCDHGYIAIWSPICLNVHVFTLGAHIPELGMSCINVLLKYPKILWNCLFHC